MTTTTSTSPSTDALAEAGQERPASVDASFSHTVRENDRPLTCDPASHTDVLYRWTVDYRSVRTTFFTCETCGSTWTEKVWRA